MALQDALSKIEEYNAIMRVPRSGLLGIGAFLAGQSARQVAEEQLSTFVEACRLAQKALAGALDSQNVHLYSALQEIFKAEAERQHFQKTLSEALEILEPVLRKVSGQAIQDVPGRERLEQLAGELRDLSDAIKRAIPRDTYLTSLTGKTHPGFGTG